MIGEGGGEAGTTGDMRYAKGRLATATARAGWGLAWYPAWNWLMIFENFLFRVPIVPRFLPPTVPTRLRAALSPA